MALRYRRLRRERATEDLSRWFRAIALRSDNRVTESRRAADIHLFDDPALGPIPNCCAANSIARRQLAIGIKGTLRRTRLVEPFGFRIRAFHSLTVSV